MDKRIFYKPQCDEPLLLVNRSSLSAIYFGAELFQGDKPSQLITRQNVFHYNSKAVFSAVRDNVEDFYIVKNGKFYDYLMFYAPCGKCPQCRRKRQMDLISRCQLETLLYDVPPYFITLTYDNEHLPFHSELNYSDVQKFFKRWRRLLDRKGIEHNIRYLVAGEYGSKSREHRPHYHLIIWNNPYNASELTPAAHRQFAKDVFYSWNNCQWSGFDFGECKGGAAPYATKYVSKGSKSYGRWTPPFIHSSIKNGGLGFQYLKQHADYFHRNPSVRSISFRDLNGSIKELNFGSYLTQHLFPSPVRQVPGKVKNDYRNFTDILFHLYCCDYLSYDYIIYISELLRPYKSVVMPRLPQMKFERIIVSGCSTYREFYKLKMFHKLERLSYVLSEVCDIDSSAIDLYDTFKSLQPESPSLDNALKRFSKIKKDGLQHAKEIL